MCINVTSLVIFCTKYVLCFVYGIYDDVILRYVYRIQSDLSYVFRTPLPIGYPPCSFNTYCSVTSLPQLCHSLFVSLPPSLSSLSLSPLYPLSFSSLSLMSFSFPALSFTPLSPLSVSPSLSLIHLFSLTFTSLSLYHLSFRPFCLCDT